MKFGIGTAQFKQNYGILKRNVNRKDLKKIFNKFNNKIDLIDTAPSSGDSEIFIGNNCNKKYKIITKVDEIKSKSPKLIINEIKLKLMNSLKNLKTNKIYCLIIHSEKNIKLLKNKKIKSYIEMLKKNKIISKIGISIYNTSKLANYLKIYNFDLVQLPLNIFNIDESEIEKVKKLKKKFKFELHVRSILFQGLIFKSLKNLPLKVQHLKKKINLINEISSIYNSSTYNFVISSIDNLKLANYAIIGISNNRDFLKLKNYKEIKVSKNHIKKITTKSSLVDLRKI